MQVNSTKIFCHSCEVKENQSDTCGLGQKCTGDYCFVHFKSLQIAQYTDESDGSDGAPLQEYIRSYQYGCINTNRPELIRPGCNQEWEGENNSAESKLTAVECICDKSYCNTEPDHFGNLWIPTVDILEQENLLEFGSGMANFSATSPFNVPLEELGSGIEDLN